jgi:Protoglobin
MEHITKESLENLSTRISYLCAFLSITSADAAILRSAQPLITPLIPSLLNAVYTKLLSFDITAKIFVPKDMDDSGKMTMAHPQIVMRKDFLRVGLRSHRQKKEIIITSSLLKSAPIQK